MMKIRTLIVDDEQHARDELFSLLQGYEDIELLPPCANAFEAIKAINQQRPCVLFLDIEMPVVNGFQLLSMIDEERMPQVVFVTAYDQFALKAFEQDTLDYLLKPVEPPRLERTLDKLRNRLANDQPPRYDTPPLQRIPCQGARRIKLLDLAQVESIFSDTAGVHVHSADGDYFTDLTLKVLEARTPLVRCHKQYLINLDNLDEILLQEGGTAKIRSRSGQLIPVSRRYLRLLKEQLGL